MRRAATPVALTTVLLVLGLGLVTALQARGWEVFFWRFFYALGGAIALLAVELAWPHDPLDVDASLGFPPFGDTHPHVSDADLHAYLDETEAAATHSPRPARAAPARPPGETHEEYCLELANFYAKDFHE